MLRATSVQYRPIFASADANAARIVDRFYQACNDGADLVVFPEAALTGYCFTSKDEAMAASVEVGGPILAQMADIAREREKHLVVGFMERDGDDLYNSAAMFGPNGLVGVYRKTHMPFIGADRFAKAGNELPVFDTPIGKFGILICYDVRFPEAAITLALKGAEMLIVPTNWPEGAETAPNVRVPCRAAETRTFVLAANRVGPERNFDFIGHSGIWDMNGQPLVLAAHRDEAMVTANVDLEQTHNKRLVIRPGEYEMDPMKDRRTDLYVH